MEFSPQQNEALSRVNRWLKQPLTTPEDLVFRLFGYAGTGKTTLAKHFASGVEGEVIFAAYTGKAAKVLRDKGCGDARTVHSLIYQPKIKSEARLRDIQEALREAKKLKRNDTVARLTKLLKQEQENVSKPAFQLKVDSELAFARLLILDEVSMIDGAMAEDLLSFGVPILALGDPFQLPPVGKAGFFTEHKPDFLLTEIHRQAAESPVLQIATMIREEKRLPLGDYGTSRIIQGRPPEDEATGADQIIVGRNKTKLSCNLRMRQLSGLAQKSPFPVAGDRLVCLKNNHDAGYMNGALFTCVEQTGLYEDLVQLKIHPEEYPAQVDELSMFTAPFMGDEPEGSWWDQKDTDKFDYGYALTCHKSQGSQWDSVLIFDEGPTFNARWRWIYTAVTRAADRVVVVKNN